MPIYEYECVVCGKYAEVMQKFSDAPLATCSECGGQMKKLISNTSFVLKGDGWYVTDYARKNTETDKKRTGDKETKVTGDAKTKPTQDSTKEAKPETKKEPASAA